MADNFPNFDIENANNGIIAGIDEAGRGPIAGPVVASCVILNQDNYPKNINDSKKISTKARKQIFQDLKNNAKFGIGIISEKIIDKINILNATKLAMRLAFQDLCKKYQIKPDFIIVDGNFITKFHDIQAQAIIKGDQKSLSIAAASIIAKETRDNIMLNLAQDFPDYHWHKNQGYPTREHLQKINEIGICQYHRKSFAPIKNYQK